ncbi:GmrSD restriction endonuclease domain-containing protein [Nostoc sp.]|uniref:GmrSD restriction endonuclease domain-containing protein n=1 Tax=Nostoc sp. TaxID=1180 RepID=UPI002FFA5A1A
MSTAPRPMTVNEAYRLYRSGNLLVNRKYQRKLVWTVSEKEKLIGSILLKYPIPLILLAERPKIHGSGKYEIIDGMQRLNAIFSFIENTFTFEKEYFDINEFSYARQLAEDGIFEKIQDDSANILAKKKCADIVDYLLAVTVYTAMEEEDITEIFGRINSSGKHLSRQERRQAGVTTLFAEVVRTIAMKLRGDDSEKILRLPEMPEISIDSKQSNQGYKIQADDTIWCKQGALTVIQLRESEDEQMIADIVASILLNEPLSRSTERFDDLYDPNSSYAQKLENALIAYLPKRLEEEIIKTFSILRETIESYSSESKCLLKIVNPKSNNPIPTAFYTIFMAFFDLIIHQELSPTDPSGIMNALRNLQQRLDLSHRYTKTEDRKNNINSTEGLIQNLFARREPPVLGHGVELALDFENSLRRSRIETTRYECKQGFLDLSPSRKFNNDLLEKIIETICGIANLCSATDGYIHIGVTDSKEDADKIEKVDKIQPLEINGRYVVGIEREVNLYNKAKDTEQYVRILSNAIQNSALTEPLKAQVLAKFDTILYKGLSVIRITVPPQTAVSFVGKTAFTRQHSSTISVEGPELLAINQLFQK